MNFPLIRHLSDPVTPLLARLPFSANQITAASLVAGLGSAFAVAQGGGRDLAVVAGVLMVVCYVLDNCDGEIARLKNQCSEFGRRFDSFVDWAVHSAFFAALGIGVSQSTGDAMWSWMGWIAAAGGTVNYAVGFFVEARERRLAEAAGIAARSGHEAPDATHRPHGLKNWLVFALRELSRADFCFIVLALALADGLWLLLPAGAIGAQVYWMTQFVKGARDYHV